uniref:MBOAT_2 domain-containing protein n=1 Tax=Angiostrongylus cantonensis TaxID=6313 RepID=A0A0K0D3H9_ANGCA
MDSLRRFWSAVYEFWRSTIEWRSPASAPYLMIVNMAFWSTALYCSELVQTRLLLTLAASVVGWDVLLSPTHERNIATHVVLWPLQSIWRTLSVCGCLYSSHQLRLQQLETACIAAYGTVGCLLLNPVWNYYEINQKIVNGVTICGRKTADVAKLVIIHPLQRVYQAVEYILLLRFIPPLWYGLISFLARIRSSIKDGVRYVVSSIKNSICMTINYFESFIVFIKIWISETIIEPTKRKFYAFGRWLRYWFCAEWWPDLRLWIKNRIGQPLRRAFNYFCFGLVYVLCGHWISTVRVWLVAWLRCFKDFIMAQARRLRDFIHRTVVVPTKK